MIRLSVLALSAFALAACAPEVPDSARGVGFESYSDYMRRRDAELAGGRALPPGPVISTERVSSAPLPALGAPAPVASAPLSAPVGSDRPRADTFAGIAPQAGEVRLQTGGTRISDEQDFDAVASRESIESDRQRLEQQRQQYVVIQPGALPERSGPQGPNIVEYALSTRHNPGTVMHRRSTLRLNSFQRACGAFVSADLAQEEFLRRGGPERDPLGVDPDGDGFACGWDPRPFRAALR